MVCLVVLELEAWEGNHRVVGIYVCLAGWFIRTTTLGAGYEKSCHGALLAAFLSEYVGKLFLPCLVLKEPCFHGVKVTRITLTVTL